MKPSQLLVLLLLLLTMQAMASSLAHALELNGRGGGRNGGFASAVSKRESGISEHRHWVLSCGFMTIGAMRKCIRIV